MLVSTAIMAPLWYGIGTKWPVGTDLIFYSTALKAFSNQFWSGDLYPRWLMDVNAGYGSPVFVFYPPLTFYVSSLLQFLAPIDPHGMGRTLLSMQLALCASGITCWLWLRSKLPEKDAQTAGLIYAGFPSLALIIYYDYGVSQLWALAEFPLLLLAAERIGKQGLRAMAPLAMGFTVLALTHLPSTMIFSPIVVFYGAFCALPRQRWNRFILAGFAGLLGAGLAAFFLMPVYANEAYISSKYFLQGNGYYADSFSSLRNLVAVMTILVIILGLFLEVPKKRRDLFDAETRFWLLVVVTLSFMTSYIALPLWHVLTPLHYLQFSWRMLVGAIPATVYIAIRWLPHVKSKQFFLWFSGLMFAANGYVTEESLFTPSARPLGNILQYSFILSQEYRTRWMDEHGIGTYKTFPERLHDMQPAEITQGKGNVTVVSSEQRQIHLKADIQSSEAKVRLRRFYFPGWQSVEPGRDGLMSITVPRGKHDITLTLPWYEGERTGCLISLASLIAWLGLWVFSRRREATQ